MKQEVHETLLEVNHEQEVIGSLEAGVTVTNSALLSVKGSVCGPVTVESGSFLYVLGAFVVHPQVILRGRLFVGGSLTGDFGSINYTTGGVLAVAVNSLVETPSGYCILREDGSLELSNNGENLNIRTDHFCLYNPTTRTFGP